jgi:DnaJ family protein C protein 9
VSAEATDDEIKKAYRRLSLLNHPDKVAASASSPEDLAAATLKFQQIGFAYTVLKDAARREKYDLTGSTMEMSAEGAKTEAEWRDYFKELWTGEVSAQSIDDFAKKYQGTLEQPWECRTSRSPQLLRAGSDEERGDILEAYKASSGDIDSIFSSVMCATVDDEDRFVKLINDAIAAKEIKATPAWKKAVKDTKGKERRKKAAEKEAKEAEELAKELGVHDKLYGNGSSSAKGGKGKGKDKKADTEDDEASLRALIQGNQTKRMNSLIDSLEAKYAAAEAKKGKKRSSTGGEEGAKGGKKAKKEVEPTEEEFAAIQAKMDARRGKK